MIALLMLMPVIALAPIRANAASAINITIDRVTRRYKDAAKWLGYVNDLRSSKNLGELKMDADLLEKAMKHAAELSVYLCDDYLDGTSFLNEGTKFRSEMYSYGDILSRADIISENNSTIMSAAVKSIGIGYVEGMGGIKYIVMFTSADTPNEVDSSVLTQSNTTISQDTRCLVQYLDDVELNFPENQAFVCGSEATLRYVVTNAVDDSCKAYISATSKLTSSDESYIKITGTNTIMGIQPGKSVVTMTMTSYPSISITHTYRATSATFKDCTISAIPDQLYSGSALTPSVTVTKSDGTVLTVGTHYTLTYYNNINVGTGGVVVTGVGTYAGRSGTATFKIVDNPKAFGTTLSLNKSEMELGETVKLSATSTNGTDPVSYKFEYCAPGSTTYTVAQSSSTASSCSVKPVSVGKYTFRVTATDKAGKTAIATATMNVHTALKLNATVTSSDIALGNTITVKGLASGGITPYTYEISVKLPGASSYTVLSNYSTTYSYVYKPTTAGSYEFRVRCKDSYGSIVTGNQTVNVTSNTFTNTSTISTTVAGVGTKIILTGSATGGQGGYKYTYSYKKSSDSSYTVIGTANGTSKSASFTPAATGIYYAKVAIMDGDGTTKTKSFTINVNEAVSALVNNSTISATSIAVGKSVTLTGKASGGAGSYKYAFQYKLSTASSWITIGTAYSTATTATFTPGTAATYDVRVMVKDAYGTITTKTFTLKATSTALSNNSSISATSVTAGTAVKLTGSASGGSGSYKYAFQYKKSSSTSWSTIGTAYGTATTGSFTPGAAATYDVRVMVKDAAGTIATKTFTVKVSGSVLTNSSTISATSVNLGTAVKLTGSASGGSGSYKYAFQYKKSSSTSWSTIGTAYGTATTGSFTPGAAATYDVRVMVKDAAGTIATKTFTVKVSGSVLTNSSTISATSVNLGTAVKLTGSASGGSGSYKYAFQYKKSSSTSWSTIGTAYGTATSATFKPGAAATYDIRVIAKDTSGTTAAKTFTLKVTQSVLVNNSTISTTSVLKGNAVTLKGAASGGTGSYKYAFFYKQQSDSSWKTLGTKYGTSTSETLTPGAEVIYDIMIKVKDTSGTEKSKTFTLVVHNGTLTNTSKPDSATVAAGSAVKINGTARGGTKPYSFAYYYKLSSASSWTTLSAYSANTSASFTTKTKGTYNIKVKVKDATGNIADKTFNVEIS